MKVRNKTLSVIILCVFILIAFIFIVSLVFSTGGGLFAKQTYLYAWEKDHYKKYSDPRLQIIAHAILSPSSYNLQPWQISLDKENLHEFLVFINTAQIAQLNDPLAREAVISIGAFLEYVNVASLKLGYNANIEYFPQGEIGEEHFLTDMSKLPIAKVSISTALQSDNALSNNIYIPSTNRSKYKSVQLTELQVNTLISQTHSEYTTLQFYNDTANINYLKEKMMESVNIEAHDKDVLFAYKQNFKTNELDKNTKPYGLSFEASERNKLLISLKQGAITAFPSLFSNSLITKTLISNTKTATESLYNAVFIITPTNSRLHQLESGRTYARLLLNAHDLGLTVYPLSRVCQDFKPIANIVSDVNEKYTNGKKIQMMCKIGVPTKSSIKSPRMDVIDIIRPE